MSQTKIPVKVKTSLWVKAAGRCQYKGCNQPLWKDELSFGDMNKAYIAHIIADSPNGTRGDKILSEQLKEDISNLMLLCDAHHRLIDIEDKEGHPVELLNRMKQDHESRIEILTSIQPERKSQIILYGANIGLQSPNLSFNKVAEAILPDRYPVDNKAIELSLLNSLKKDDNPDYWKFEKDNLNDQYLEKIKPHLSKETLSHISLFALAPIPLLAELGRLFTDIPVIEVFQLHREPQTWNWQNVDSKVEYNIIQPDQTYTEVALKLSLSATINNNRVEEVLGKDVSIWELKIDQPNNDYLQSKEHLSEFRKSFRKLLDKIKDVHGSDAKINVFPAVPVSVAVEIGRTWMPKADLPLIIYDQNSNLGGFVEAFEISNNHEVGVGCI